LVSDGGRDGDLMSARFARRLVAPIAVSLLEEVRACKRAAQDSIEGIHASIRFERVLTDLEPRVVSFWLGQIVAKESGPARSRAARSGFTTQ
jgi:hypothetical protein